MLELTTTFPLQLKRGGKLEKAEVLEIAVQFIREVVASKVKITPTKLPAHGQRKEDLQGKT